MLTKPPHTPLLCSTFHSGDRLGLGVKETVLRRTGSRGQSGSVRHKRSCHNISKQSIYVCVNAVCRPMRSTRACSSPRRRKPLWLWGSARSSLPPWRRWENTTHGNAHNNCSLIHCQTKTFVIKIPSFLNAGIVQHVRNTNRPQRSLTCGRCLAFW